MKKKITGFITALIICYIGYSTALTKSAFAKKMARFNELLKAHHLTPELDQEAQDIITLFNQSEGDYRSLTKSMQIRLERTRLEHASALNAREQALLERELEASITHNLRLERELEQAHQRYQELLNTVNTPTPE